jgi:murein DD-endopeptidase MepM/ murein hydrolase activator NlpD
MWMTHNGIDISAAKDTKVVAALPGTVKKIATDPTKGQIVTITHSGNQTTVYVGLSEVNVKEGAKVNAGQKIGVAGTPGFEAAEGPHLHFEYIQNGSYVDPVKNMESTSATS